MGKLVLENEDCYERPQEALIALTLKQERIYHTRSYAWDERDQWEDPHSDIYGRRFGSKYLHKGMY